MSVHFDFDPANKILRCRIEGPLTNQVLRETYELIDKYAAMTMPRAGIFDLSAVTSVDVTAHEIQVQAARPPALPDPDRPRFIVAPGDPAFGMSRMFQLLGESTRPNLHVVRSLDEAYALLGISEPRFEPVNASSLFPQTIPTTIAG